jgi:hypothetical protein
MMMRMLDEGGLPPLMDGFRQADEDNPLGYYEFERVKQLGKDNSWLPEAYNKVVKIIYVFLYKLPPEHRYKVIFMRRNLDEVVMSQKTMLRRRQEGDRMSDERLVVSYDEQLQQLDLWIRKQPNFTVLYLNYDEVIGDPAGASGDIAQFLGLPLDREAMARSVEPALHRNRSALV